ncbi:MAG: aldo/keto reductase, partial [Chloroflexi bacterium]|nr:aldo/keto reductase [Chloroflexota bacterium]
MEYRTLGRTGLKVSLLGYGTGGAGKFGVTAGLDAEARNSLVRRCLELGVNFFDTSRGYGNSEEFLGESLSGIPRDSYVLCTKWTGAGWL